MPGWARNGWTRKEKLLRKLRAVGPAVRTILIAELGQEANELANAMRRAAPVLTGALKASIRVEDIPDQPLKVAIKAGGVPSTRTKVRKGVKNEDFAAAKAAGNNKGEFDYTRSVEFGSSPDGTNQRPFFFPTYRARKKGIKRRVKSAARKKVLEIITK